MKIFQKMFHKCKPKLVAVNDEYHTTYKGTSKIDRHHLRFYCCSCGRRSFTTDYTHTHRGRHSGIEKARKNWIETGVVPDKSYHPESSKHYVKIDALEREILDPVLAYQKTLEDIQKSLAVVINRDFDLESQYPELKKAADEYHRKLDKYRNFEKLKENNNEL
jgi:flavodoxin